LKYDKKSTGGYKSERNSVRRRTDSRQQQLILVSFPHSEFVSNLTPRLKSLVWKYLIFVGYEIHIFDFDFGLMESFEVSF